MKNEQTMAIRLDRPLRRWNIGTLLGGDANETRYRLAVLDAQGEADVRSGAVTCYLVRADRTTLVWPGQVEDNRVCWSIPQAGHSVPGQFVLSVEVSVGDVIRTLLMAEGVIAPKTTEVCTTPQENQVPTTEQLQEILSRLMAAKGEALAAAQAAEEATDGVQGVMQRVEDTLAQGEEAVEEALFAAQTADAAADAAEEAAALAEEAAQKVQAWQEERDGWFDQSFDKRVVHNTLTEDTTFVPSAAVTYQLSQQLAQGQARQQAMEERVGKLRVMHAYAQKSVVTLQNFVPKRSCTLLVISTAGVGTVSFDSSASVGIRQVGGCVQQEGTSWDGTTLTIATIAQWWDGVTLVAGWDFLPN